MATRSKSRRPRRATAAATPPRLLYTVQQIYLAGLGAAARARSGAPQLFLELVSEGARVHAGTRGAAEKALKAVAGSLRSGLDERVGQVRGQTNEALDGLEKIFQTRVHRALGKLGVPRAEDVQALSKRVDALNASVEKLAARPRRAARPRSRAVARMPAQAPAL